MLPYALPCCAAVEHGVSAHHVPRHRVPGAVEVAVRTGDATDAAIPPRAAVVDVGLEAECNGVAIPAAHACGDILLPWADVVARAPAGSVVLPGSRLRTAGVLGTIITPQQARILLAVDHHRMGLLRKLGCVIRVALPMPGQQCPKVHSNRAILDKQPARRHILLDGVLWIPVRPAPERIICPQAYDPIRHQFRLPRHKAQPQRYQIALRTACPIEDERSNPHRIGQERAEGRDINLPATLARIRRHDARNLEGILLGQHVDVGNPIPGVPASGRTVQGIAQHDLLDQHIRGRAYDGDNRILLASHQRSPVQNWDLPLLRPERCRDSQQGSVPQHPSYSAMCNVPGRVQI